MEDILLKAKETCIKYHEGQTDKAGQPYCEHPLRVSSFILKSSEIKDDEFMKKAMVTAMLHDTLEDTDYTLSELTEDFGEEIADAVLSVTRKDGESYMDFVRRAGEHPIGRIVKFFDLTDNLDMKRFSVCPDYKITKDDVARIKKYTKAYRYLKTKIDEG
jgi:hypothetical protein